MLSLEDHEIDSSTLGPTFNSHSLFSHLPLSSFDWGDSGYAGCSSCGGELLFLSALSDSHNSDGLVMARGNFSTSLYASLSRAQMEFGGPATFGLEVSRVDHTFIVNGNEEEKKGSSFQLGSMIERGAFNYRWPFNEYYLDLHEAEGAGEIQSKKNHVGTCQMFSYTKEGIFYQILRIEEGGHVDGNYDSWSNFPGKPQIVLTMGGPVWFHTFKDEDRLHDHVLRPNADRVFDMNEQYPPSPPPPPGTPREPAKAKRMRFWDEKRKIGLEANVYQYHPGKRKPYERLLMTQSKAAADNGPDEVQGEFRVRAYNAFVRLPHVPGQKHVHTFVAAIRLFEGAAKPRADWRPKLPTSEEMYRHIGVSPGADHATGAMWDTVFIERREKWNSFLDLAEVHLVGRTLEKTLQVALIPAPFYEVIGNPQQRSRKANRENLTSRVSSTPKEATTALVSNLFIRPNVDLKAIL